MALHKKPNEGRTVAKCCCLQLCLTGAVAVLLFQATARGERPSLVKAVTQTGDTVYGELLHDDDGRIEILNLQTGRQQKLKVQEVTSLDRNVSDEEVYKLLGFPTLVAWRVKKSVPPGQLVAVLAIRDEKGRVTADSKGLAEKLAVALKKCGVQLVEATRINQAKDALNRIQRKGFDPTTAAKCGKLLAAHAVLAGTLASNRRFTEVQLRLVQVDSAQMIASFGSIVDRDITWRGKTISARASMTTSTGE
jgi:hypothetical protein